MSDINKVILIGNAGRDIEVRYTQSGKVVGTLSLATTATINGKRYTTWHNVVIWSDEPPDIKKGDRVLIEGRLATRSWEKDGEKRYITEVVADTWRVLIGNRKEEEPQDDDEEIPF